MISTPTVRRAVDSDAAKIADLLGELGYSTHPSFILSRLQLVAARPDDAVFVAESAEQVIGVISVHVFAAFHADVWIGRITSMVVGAHQRRKGIGKQLVAAAESFCAQRRCTQIEVTSGGTHEPAPQFYQSNGYEYRDQHLVKSPS